PEGVLWLFRSSRRGRKTWTLKGIEHRLTPTVARHLDLRIQSLPNKPPAPGFCLLLDEPSKLLCEKKSAKTFLQQCARLHERNVRIVLALTPRELSLLEEADTDRTLVSFSAMLRLPAFSPAEID